MQLKKVSLSKQRYRPHTGWFNIAFHKFEDILYDHKQVEHVNTYWSENVCDLQRFKIDTCCKFLGSYRLCIYVNMFTLDIALHTQIITARHCFVAIAMGLLNFATKVFPT
jgi:hypothetical protein